MNNILILKRFFMVGFVIVWFVRLFKWSCVGKQLKPIDASEFPKRRRTDACVLAIEPDL